MALATIISNLATRGGTVTGIKTSYDQDDTPENLKNAQLPALLHFAGGGENDMRTFDGQMWNFAHTITVQLFYKAAGKSRLEENIAGIVTRIDSYITSIRAYHNAGGACEDLYVSAYSAPGNIVWGGVEYHGVEFTVVATEYIVP
jgi:hypothetical protein